MNLSKHRLWYGCFAILLFLLLLLTALAPTAQAAGKDPVDLGVVELTGNSSKGKFHLTPEKMDDLFVLDGSIYPGASWKKTVHVENEGKREMEFCIISCTTNDADTILFDALETKVVADGKVIYHGPYGAGSNEVPMTEFFRIDGHESMDFEIIVWLDSSAGNELQGKSMTSTWEFGAVYDQADGPGESAKPDAGKDPTPPSDEQTPESPEGPDLPSGVKTGVELEETSYMSVILMILMLLCIILSGFIVWKTIPVVKKKEADSNREEDTKHE